MMESSIQAASRLCGVGIHTLRAWEKRYGAVTPTRAENGRRLYSDDDIHKLQMLNELCKYGNSIGSIANYSTLELTQLLAKFSKKTPAHPIDPEGSQVSQTINVDNILKHTLLALNTYKLDVISHELHKMIGILNPRELVLNVVVPLLFEVNARVKQGKITTMQEIAILSIIKFHVSDILYGAWRSTPRSDKVLVFISPENLDKELGILCCALVCAHYRHKAFYFDHHLSIDVLGQTTEAIGANYLVLDARHFSEQYLPQYLTKLLGPSKCKQTLLLLSDDHLSLDGIYKHTQHKCFSSLQQFDDLVKDF